MRDKLPKNIISKEEQEKIITNNIDLPRILAFSLIKQKKNRNLDADSLISAGNEGMLSGAERYDPEKAASPRTYLQYWAKAKMLEAIRENRNVHIPANVISEVTNKRFNNNNSIVSVHKEYSLDIEKSDEGIESSISADKIQYSIANTNSLDIFDKESLRRIISNCSLSSLEREVINARFGLTETEPKTLKEISEAFGYTIMGIQKAEKRALKKIRDSKEFIEAFVE